jgi:hypothetical protein
LYRENGITDHLNCGCPIQPLYTPHMQIPHQVSRSGIGNSDGFELILTDRELGTFAVLPDLTDQSAAIEPDLY